MFERDPEQAQQPSGAASGWSLPGRPAAPAEPAQPHPAGVALVDAVDTLLAQDLEALSEAVALHRCRVVLAQAERLAAAAATALADMQARELWAADGAGSLSGWLRQQPCSDAGRSTRARRLPARPKVLAAVATGTIGLSTADVLCKALSELPETCEPGQVEGVLAGAVPELLSRWVARNALDPAHDAVADARAALLSDTVEAGLVDVGAAPADRLEAAFVLVGQAVGPAVLASQLQLQLLVEALLPEELVADEAGTYDGRSLVLRKKKLQPGYRLRGELTDEVGARLQAELDARAAARAQAEASMRRVASGQGEEPDLFGTAGLGTPTGWSSTEFDADAHDPPLQTADQLAHDLFGELLDDVTCTREPGTPQPATITITAGVDTLEGRSGSLPATLLLPDGPYPMTPDALRRLGCHSRLNAVLLDAARTPVGASGTHRSATERERRALRARWGDHCAANGCPSTRTVPHHVRPWWQTGRTTLEDLVPLCKSNHHDLHDGHRTLRLRDGRLIDENGWVDRLGAAGTTT